MNSLKHITNLTDLIEVAVKDMRMVKASPDHTLDVSVWHAPPHPEVKGRCAVCVAGAIMAGTLGTPPTASVAPDSFDEDTADMLNLLDSLRLGEHIYVHEHLDNLEWLNDIPRYEHAYSELTDSQRSLLEEGDLTTWEHYLKLLKEYKADE